MKELNPETAAGSENPGLNIGDILFIVFKHKRKIVTSAALGLIAAVAVYFLWPQLYVSEAKLFVRYLVDRNAIDPVESAAGTRRDNDAVIRSEVEILTSWDLATQVAEATGPSRL